MKAPRVDTIAIRIQRDIEIGITGESLWKHWADLRYASRMREDHGSLRGVTLGAGGATPPSSGSQFGVVATRTL